MSLRPGMPAPDFDLEATVKGEFRKIKLSDYRGKWVVLFFYPADFTFVCPTEIAAFAAKNRELEEKGVQVLAASIDTKFAHKIWQEGELAKMIPEGVPFPMLADLSGKVGKLYEVYDESLGLDLRGVFIIDPDGILQSVQVLNAPVGRDVDEVVRQVQAFQHVRNMKGAEACPIGWKPGKATLKPATGLVGKVAEAWKVGQ
jgi:NADH-dependent peroxiredoxin subunit C